MSDEDISIDEKRVYADSGATTTAFVASGAGLARVAVSDDIVGEFSLAERTPAVDVAAGDGRVVVATRDDVLIGDGESFTETGFGSASAVGYHDGIVAAGDGRIARYADGDWTALGDVEGVRAVDGDLVAAASGVHRLDGTHLGLEDVRDVSAAADPLAATATGLYYLGNGWMEALDGDFRAVAARPDGRAHAATSGSFYERSPAGEWTAVDLPAGGTVVDVAYADAVDADDAHADATYAVTRDGTFLANAGDGWRHRTLGLPDVAAVAVLE